MNAKLAKDALLDVKSILDKEGVKFFLDWGTCLGAYRDKKFIDWDYDIDLAIKTEYFVENYQRLRQLFLNFGFAVEEIVKPFGYCWKFYLKRDDISVDMHSIHLLGDKRFIYVGRGKDVTVVMKAKYFEKGQEIDFLGEKFLIPSPVKEYLTDEYGKDFMTPRKDIVSSLTRREGFFKENGLHIPEGEFNC